MSGIINLLYNVVDRIYIGRIPEVGTTALTGVGLCFPIISLITAFTYLYGNGGAPLCSMERGKGNDEEAEHLMGNAFTLLIGTGIVLTIIGLIFYKPILYLFGASDDTFPYAGSYIQIYLLGTVFVMVSVGMNPFINSQGFGNTGMISVLIGAVLNIILDPIFIFVKSGSKRSGYCDDHFSVLLDSMGTCIPDRKTGSASFEMELYVAAVETGFADHRSGSIQLYHGIYKQSGTGCM